MLIASAALVALNNDVSKWGYVMSPVGNLMLLIYFILKRDIPQILLSLVMLGITVTGFFCWVIESCSR